MGGRPYSPRSPSAAESLGVVRVAQEPATVPSLSVAENTYLGHLPRSRGVVDWPRLFRLADASYQRLNIPIDVRAPAAGLSMAQQQLVVIAAALVHEARLLIMDEPTSTITEHETEALFRIMRHLRDTGVAILFISHRLEEVFTIADRVTVMRDGRVVTTLDVAAADPARLVKSMVGRNLSGNRLASKRPPGEPVLEARAIRRAGAFEDISFTLHAGEIVGLTGFVGAGRTEVARALFGADRLDGGLILIDGQPIVLRSPIDGIRLGIGLVPEDRRSDALALNLSVLSNLSLLALRLLSRFGSVRPRAERGLVARLSAELEICPSDPTVEASALSGGNQQKVVIGRWLARRPRVLLLDEPTRGIDVGAKAEVHRLIRALADDGMAVLMISSELPEVLRVPDRLLVMREGRLLAEFRQAEATEEAVIRAASGLAVA